MAFLHPTLFSPSVLLRQPTNPHPFLGRKPIFHLSASLSSSSPLTKLEPPPVREPKPDDGRSQSSGHPEKHPQKQNKDNNNKNDFYLNLGVAVRTLREDLPNLFSKDLNYDIYREDITFVDPLNTFQGIENYKLIFWALRFHGRILFREIDLEIFRVWQPSENMILIRWNLRGVPRVPWEAKGQFQGTSRYKLDRNGKIYEHKVDNLAFNFPRMAMRPATVLDLVGAGCPASPNLSFLFDPIEEAHSCSWVEFYRLVRETVDRQGHLVIGGHDGLVSCS